MLQEEIAVFKAQLTSMAKLNPNQRIYDVMGEIQRGTYRIPNIQRGFEWNKPRVLKLLDSIMHGYPIGAIMVWKPTPVVVGTRKKVPDVATRVAGMPVGRLAVNTPVADTVPVE